MKYYAKYRQIPMTNDKQIQNESNVNRLRSLPQKLNVCSQLLTHKGLSHTCSPNLL